MTTLRDLPPGTRCLVDVAAMERDGPETHSCSSYGRQRNDLFIKALRTLAEQVVIVNSPTWCEWPCCGLVFAPRDDHVTVLCYTGRGDEGYVLQRKYLVPLPEQGGGEGDGR